MDCEIWYWDSAQAYVDKLQILPGKYLPEDTV